MNLAKLANLVGDPSRGRVKNGIDPDQRPSLEVQDYDPEDEPEKGNIGVALADVLLCAFYCLMGRASGPELVARKIPDIPPRTALLVFEAYNRRGKILALRGARTRQRKPSGPPFPQPARTNTRGLIFALMKLL